MGIDGVSIFFSVLEAVGTDCGLALEFSITGLETSTSFSNNIVFNKDS